MRECVPNGLDHIPGKRALIVAPEALGGAEKARTNRLVIPARRCQPTIKERVRRKLVCSFDEDLPRNLPTLEGDPRSPKLRGHIKDHNGAHVGETSLLQSMGPTPPERKHRSVEDLGNCSVLELEELWGGPEELQQIVQHRDSIGIIGKSRIIGR